jgi:hypothetical protein
MGLIEDLDEEARRLALHPDETYEAAIGLTHSARRHAHGSSERARAAASLRDTFGTYVERMQSAEVSTELSAAAHDGIALAAAEWLASGRDDIVGFSARWQTKVGEAQHSWLDEGVPLRKVHGFARWRFRRHRLPNE